MKKFDLIIVFVLLALAVSGVCLLFTPSAWVNARTGSLLGVLILYIPVFILIASNTRGSREKRARVFLYGGFLLLILAATVWHTLSGDMLSPTITEGQKEALRYYQQVVILLCSAVGGSSIFHGIRLFNDALNE
ncbi:MAG: hypothetical protein ABIP97_10920 [Chthoniobacterales bacterium]